jgi:hypothetical protein
MHEREIRRGSRHQHHLSRCDQGGLDLTLHILLRVSYPIFFFNCNAALILFPFPCLHISKVYHLEAEMYSTHAAPTCTSIDMTSRTSLSEYSLLVLW